MTTSQSLKFKDSQVIECGWNSVSVNILNYHYLKTMPAGILAVYGLFDSNGFECLGCAVFTNGRIQYEGKYLEFSRLWLTDELPTNSESWFVSRCLKKLKCKFPSYEGVVTWADCARGHNGTVYKALNFVFDGKSRKVKKYKGKGKAVIYQRTATKDSILVGEESQKNRFIYYFDKRTREKKRNDEK